MKKSKLLLAAVIILAVVIVWAFYADELKQFVKSGKSESPTVTSGPQSSESKDKQLSLDKAKEDTGTSPEKANPEVSSGHNDPNKPADPNQQERSTRLSRRGRRSSGPRGTSDSSRASFSKSQDNSESENIGDPNDPLVALNLKDVQMTDIIQKLSEWTGKVIIPHDDAMKQKITIYAPEKLPRSQALNHIYAALRTKGFVAESDDKTIYLKPLKDAILGKVPTIGPDDPLAMVENKSQIVQKFFKLENYSPSKMADVIKPLIGDNGYVSADDNSGSMMVIESVDNLMRFEKIISQFDVSDSEQTVERIFKIKYADPAEIVQVLRKLMGIDDKSTSGIRSNGRNISSRSMRPGQPGGRDPRQNNPNAGKKGDSKQGEVTTVTIKPSQIPITLIPEPNRKWIVASASVGDMKLIEEWIERLDTQQDINSESETIAITYADVREVAMQINEALQEMPGSELRTSVLIQPLAQSKQIMIFGRKEIRDMVKKLIEEIDIPSNVFETRVFKLKNADPDTIKENLEGLYESQSGYSSNYRYGRYSSRNVDPEETVKVISYPTMSQVTVIASPENLVKIEEQINEWDVPLDVEDVKPRIIEMHNSDPVKMANLLTNLFSDSGSDSWLDRYFGKDETKIIGALHGKLTFEAVPDTKKIIVISKIPAAYTVVEELIKELDSMEIAELPMVITLNYADAEDLCDQLNAILNEPGTVSTIRRSQRGLSSYTPGDSATGSNSTDSSSNSTDIIQPWWNRGGTNKAGEEMPTSNLIGRIRFIPVHRSKAILVLSPKEYQQSIKDMIAELDQPGKQVMVKAIIIQVDHNARTTLGTKFSSAGFAISDIGQNAVTALTQLDNLETHGTLTMTNNINVTALVDLLVKKANGKILNQPTLWTKDNEEAVFFKGRNVAFIENAQTSLDARSTTEQYSYEDIGVTLRIRPNITPEKNVDMTINLKIEEIEPEPINTQVAKSKLDTTTNLIVEDGQTIMMSGILFKNKTEINSKVPLLGDIPLVGNLFRHYDNSLTDNELLVFITPYVIDGESSEKTTKELDESQEKLEKALTDLNGDIEKGLQK